MSRGYNKDDFFYTNATVCSSADVANNTHNCAINKEVSGKMVKAKNAQQAAEQRYSDVNVYVNREIQFSVNLLAGLGLLLYYCVKNDFVSIANITSKNTPSV
jgi:hypothetical protein